MELDLRNLIFSLSGFKPETELEKNLSEQNLSLEEYLKKEDAIQCFKDMKTNAQKYFDRDKIKQLIKYITEVPKENEYNIGYKYPYVASEMLKSAGERIQDMIVFTEEEFNKKYKKEVDEKVNEKNKSTENTPENEKVEEKEKVQENKEEEKQKENEINTNIKEEKKGKNILIEIEDSNDTKESNKKLKEDSIKKEKEIKVEKRKINIDKHNELLDLLLDFVTKKDEVLNDVLCGYFSSVLLSLLNSYPADIFLYLLFLRKDALEQIILHSYQKSLSNISARLLKFEQYYSEIESKEKVKPGLVDLDFLKSQKETFEKFRLQILTKIITSIDLKGMKGENGSYLEGIDIESIFLMLYDILGENSVVFSLVFDDKINLHIFKILQEGIFNDKNKKSNDNMKKMYNYFIIYVTKILHYMPEVQKKNDSFYPEYDFESLFGKIKIQFPLFFKEHLMICIPKILAANFLETSSSEKGPLGLHNIYLMDLIIELFKKFKNLPTTIDFLLLQSGFMDKSISYFFNHQLNNIFQNKFVKLFELYLQQSENHPLLTDYFFNKKKLHLILLNYINKDKESLYLNEYKYKSGKTNTSCMNIYVIDLLYKIQAASGLKLLEEKDKKELNILNYGYFEFVKDETSPKDVINLKMPKYVSDILSESKKWTDTMENKIIPLIKKFEGKLCFSKEIKPKELAKTNITEGVLNSLLMNLLSIKNKNLVIKKDEPISNYNDINFWKTNDTISEEIKNKVNSNIEKSNNSDDETMDDEDELLNIAMQLEKTEKEKKTPKNNNISTNQKVNKVLKIDTSNSSNNENLNNNEIKTNTKENKDDNKNKNDEKVEEKEEEIKEKK